MKRPRALRQAGGGGVHEEAVDAVLRQGLLDPFDELQAALLTEYLDVLEQERARVDLRHEIGVLDHEVVAVVGAGVGAALLFAEALAGRTAAEEIQLLNAESLQQLTAVQLADVGLLDVVADVLGVGLDP